MLSMKIFFQILFVWQEKDLGFSSDFENITLQQTTPSKQPPFLHTHTRPIKFDMIRVQYLEYRERVHKYFMKQLNLCDCRFHCRKLIFAYLV